MRKTTKQTDIANAYTRNGNNKNNNKLKATMNKMRWNSLTILMKNYDDIQLTVNGFPQFYLKKRPAPTITVKSISQTDKQALDIFAYMREACTKNHFEFHLWNVFVITQMKCILIWMRIRCCCFSFSFFSLRTNWYIITIFLSFFALLFIVFVLEKLFVFFLSAEAAARLIFIPNLRTYDEQTKTSGTCPQYMHNCYYVALKNLLLCIYVHISMFVIVVKSVAADFTMRD